MKIFYFSVLLSALLIAQVQCGVVQDNSDDDDSNVIVVIPTAIYKLVESVIDFITSTGISVITGIIYGVGPIEETVHNLQKIAIDYIWEFVSAKLKEIEPDSSDLVKATIECVQEQGDYIKTIVFDFASQAVSCDIEKTIMILDTFKPILVHIKNSNEVFKSLTDELVNCGNDAAALPCINEVEDKIYKELSQLGENLKDDVENASAVIEIVNISESLCVQDVSDRFQTKLNNLTSTITECIEQKYINNTIV